MARRTPATIGQDIELVHWLWWQVLRRSKTYQRSVDEILNNWRNDADRGTWKPGIAGLRRQRLLGRAIAAKRALEAYDRLEGKRRRKSRSNLEGGPFDPVSLAKEPPRFAKRFRGGTDETNAPGAIVSAGLRHRYFPVGNVRAKLGKL